MRAFAAARLSLGLAAVAVAGLADAASAAEKAGMPQLDPSSFSPQLIWLFLTFILLYLVMSKVALPKVADVLEERQNRIADDLDEADRLKRETEKAIADYELALSKARNNALGIGGQARDQANAHAAAERAKADAETHQKVKAAEAAIMAARDAAIGNIKSVAVEATQAVIDRLVQLKVSEQQAAAAVDAAMKEGR